MKNFIKIYVGNLRKLLNIYENFRHLHIIQAELYNLDKIINIKTNV